MTPVPISWTVRHGYSTEYNWVQTQEDTVEHGYIIAFVTEFDRARAVVQHNKSLITLDLDDITLT